MSDWWNQPTVPEHQTAEAEPSEPLANCPWCAAPATPDVGYCTGCGAVLAQHEDLGGLIVPGVTAVDPAMQKRDYTSAILGAQSQMSTFSMIGSVGGTSAQIAVAASMVARDSLGSFGTSVDPESVGNPSQAALEMSRRMHRSPSLPESQRVDDDPTSQTTDSTEHTSGEKPK